MTQAATVFEDALAWLRDHYASKRFYVERDIVWTVQTHLAFRIAEQQLPYRVFSEYPMLPGLRRSICTDLVLLNSENVVEVAGEFKFEPSHKRGGIDIWPGKFDATSWPALTLDLQKIRQYVDQGKAGTAYSILIDEGGYFRHRPAQPGSVWIDWAVQGEPWHKVSVHWTRVENDQEEDVDVAAGFATSSRNASYGF